MASLNTILPTLAPALGAIALFVVGIVSFNEATNTLGSSSLVRSAMLAVQPNFVALTYVTNNSDTAFCSEDVATFFFYNISNYDSIRNSTDGGAAEFTECEYILTRSRCIFDLDLTSPVTTASNFIYIPVEGSAPESTVHEFELSLAVQRYFTGEYVLSSSTCDEDLDLTLINIGYIRYVSKFSTDARGFNDAYSVVDDGPAREEQILYALFGQVFSTSFEDDQVLTNALATSNVSLTLDHVRWLVFGQSESRPPLVEYASFYYSWYGYDIPANMTRALAVDNYYWIGEGPGSDPIPTFLELVDDSQSTDTNTSTAAQEVLLNVYQLSPADAVAFAAFVNNFVATEVKAAAQALVNLGSGPVLTRPYMDFIQLGSDPLMEAMGQFVFDLELFGWGSSTIAAMLPGGEPTTREGAGPHVAQGFDHKALDLRYWSEAMMWDQADNGTLTAEDDGNYVVFSQFVEKSTENLVWHASTLFSDARPDGQVDPNGVEYAGSVKRALEGDDPLYFWMNYAFRLDVLQLAPVGTYEAGGVAVEQFGVDWEAMLTYNVNYRYVGLVPAKNLDRQGTEHYYTPRGLKQAPVLSNISVANSSPLFDDFSVFIHPESGVFSGAYFGITHVYRVGEYSLFDNHKLPAGFYPYGGGSAYSVYQRILLGGGACGGMPYLMDILDVTKCDALAAVEAADSMYLTAMICVMVQACILFVVIIASFISSLSS